MIMAKDVINGQEYGGPKMLRDLYHLVKQMSDFFEDLPSKLTYDESTKQITYKSGKAFNPTVAMNDFKSHYSKFLKDADLTDSKL